MGEPKKSKPVVIKILKIAGWSLLSVFVLLIAVCSIAVWILTPEKLTPLVKKYANEYLTADLDVESVELTFWHTFPKLTLEFDSLSIVNPLSRDLPADSLGAVPDNVDSLLFVKNFRGGVNVPKILVGNLELYDVVFDGVIANIVDVNDSISNYDIVRQSDERSTEGGMVFPDISIDRFTIIDAGPLRYRSLRDSIDVSVNLKNVSLTGEKGSDYSLSIDANSQSPLLNEMNISDLRISADGEIKWRHDSPMEVCLNDMTLTVDSFPIEFSSRIDFRNELTVKKFDFDIEGWKVSRLMAFLPQEMVKSFSNLDTDMELAMSGRLKRSYVVTDTASNNLPFIEGNFEIPKCHVHWNRLHFNSLEMKANYVLAGANLDESTFEVEKFLIDGNVLDLDLKGQFSNLISDPTVDLRLRGSIDFGRISADLKRKYASSLSGLLKANVSLKMRKSFIAPYRFQRIRLDGDIDLDKLRFISPDSSMIVEGDHFCFKFGTNKKFVKDKQPVADSLLTLSLRVDTVHFKQGYIEFSAKKALAGLGAKMGLGRADSTNIVPFGGLLSFERLRFIDRKDSLRIRMNDVLCRASLKRFENMSSKPLFNFNFNAGGILAGMHGNFLGLKKGEIDMSIHPRIHRQRVVNRGDSLKRAGRGGNSRLVTSNNNDMDFMVDSGVKSFFNKWTINGNLKADAGNLYTKSFPVRNSLKHFDASFTTDSIILRDLIYRMGVSDFKINGSISNLRRTLTRRRNNVLKIDFDVVSDTINVNQISSLFITDITQAPEFDDIDDLEKISGNASDPSPDTISSATKPFLVPSNISATLSVNAKNMVYTDLLLHDCSVGVLVSGNAINLRNLKATTEIGSIDLSALYSAPSPDSIGFGVGMKINRFHLNKMMTLVPALDTLMPLLKDFSGIVSADIAATSRITPTMDFDIPSLKAAVKLSGDSLVLLDADTFKSLSKWLMFKNKHHNMIDSMSVEMIVEDSELEIFPFIFNIDRYRLGVMGSNDLAMNLNYHISVLKSPLPFKFGINLSGNVDKPKIRLGGAKFKNERTMERVSIADTTRINLVNQIENVFRRSARANISLNYPRRRLDMDVSSESLSRSDSIMMIREGLIEGKVENDSIIVK